MWEHLSRQGIGVARCTVERLMRANGWRGVTRARKVRTTIADPAHSRAPDLVNRDFTAERPGQLHVVDFSYVPLDGAGFGYTAFVVDAFAGLIAGYGPPPHVKPHSGSTGPGPVTSPQQQATRPQLLTQNQVCTKPGMLQGAKWTTC
jgi:transposase InsO family protein